MDSVPSDSAHFATICNLPDKHAISSCLRDDERRSDTSTFTESAPGTQTIMRRDVHVRTNQDRAKKIGIIREHCTQYPLQEFSSSLRRGKLLRNELPIKKM